MVTDLCLAGDYYYTAVSSVDTMARFRFYLVAKLVCDRLVSTRTVRLLLLQNTNAKTLTYPTDERTERGILEAKAKPDIDKTRQSITHDWCFVQRSRLTQSAKKKALCCLSIVAIHCVVVPF